MYITENDILQWLSEDQLTEAKRTDESGLNKLDNAIKYAQGRIKDKLNHKFNMSAEFEKTGDSRNLTLVKICCDIAIWYMAQALELNDYEGKFYQSFDKAEKDLYQIEVGNMVGDLPTYDTDEDLTSTVKWGYTTNINDETY